MILVKSMRLPNAGNLGVASRLLNIANARSRCCFKRIRIRQGYRELLQLFLAVWNTPSELTLVSSLGHRVHDEKEAGRCVGPCR